jgi:uncharacterized protein (TIGR02599 family)
MVAVAVLALIMVMLLSMTDIMSRTWKRTTEKMQSFEGARAAFDQINANLSQAVLNTYWDYDDPVSPTNYVRRSELQFLSLPMTKLASAFPAGRTPVTHGLFFQAPTGRVADKSSFGQMPTLLNAFGYFVEYGDDAPDRPGFLPASVSPRYRYRLKEWRVPAEKFLLYAKSSGVTGADYRGDQSLDWIDLQSSVPRTLAENVVAFVAFPKNTESINLDEISLTSDYYYNSRNDGTSALEVQQVNQLPPEVEIVLVAIDEGSAIQVLNNSTSCPDLGTGLFTDPAKLDDDLGKLTKELTDKKIKYIVLRSTVKIRGARWSQN